MTPRLCLLAACVGALAAACDVQPARLPADRTPDGHIYVAPICRAHEAELWAMPIPVFEQPPARMIAPLPDGLVSADGIYLPMLHMIWLRKGLASWYRHDVELHERCHAWLHLATGNPQFHR